MGDPNSVGLLHADTIGDGPAGPQFECGRCGSVLDGRKLEVVGVPIEIPGVEGATKKALRCWKCGRLLLVGFDSPALRRIGLEVRSMADGAEKGAAMARYRAEHAKLQQRGWAVIGGRSGPGD